MPARRAQSLRHGSAAQRDGVIWHREHRSKKGRLALKKRMERDSLIDAKRWADKKARKFKKI